MRGTPGTQRPEGIGPRPVSEPLIRSTIYEFGSSEELARHFARRSDRCYARFGNPTISSAAREIARLEGAEAGLLFGSGMAAITTTLMTFLEAGCHVVAQRDIFAQTHGFLSDVASRLGVRTTFVDACDPKNVGEAIESRTVLVYVESPSNPLLQVVDIAAVARIAQSRRIPLIVDSTFATPVLQRPLALGASVVVHSATKFLGGHADVSCGAVLSDRSLVGEIYEMQRLLGGIAQPDTAWLLKRSLRTLALRVGRQCESAFEIASFLEGAHGVRSVSYPWLPSSLFGELARRQMDLGGGVVSFEVEGGLPAARALIDSCRLIRIATSLGGVDTVAEIPAELDFAAAELGGKAETEGREAETDTDTVLQVPEGLVRLSVGLEDPGELIADLARALAGACPIHS